MKHSLCSIAPNVWSLINLIFQFLSKTSSPRPLNICLSPTSSISKVLRRFLGEFYLIKSLIDEQGTLVFNGNTPLKFVIVPKIRNFLVSLILKTLAHFFEEKFYERLFSDVILNCLVIGDFEFSQ